MTQLKLLQKLKQFSEKTHGFANFELEKVAKQGKKVCQATAVRCAVCFCFPRRGEAIERNGYHQLLTAAAI